ncbi:MAG: hypothetical protein JWM03_1001, partial [Rhodocyclales bacterium]|nr:hypothetical protein [Rhodocyclales bacterium]
MAWLIWHGYGMPAQTRLERSASASDVKGFAATALVLDVGIVELETLVQALAHEIQFRAIDI